MSKAIRRNQQYNALGGLCLWGITQLLDGSPHTAVTVAFAGSGQNRDREGAVHGPALPQRKFDLPTRPGMPMNVVSAMLVQT